MHKSLISVLWSSLFVLLKEKNMGFEQLEGEQVINLNVLVNDPFNNIFLCWRKVQDRLFSLHILFLISENPCKVYVEPPEIKNPLKESEEFTVNCSTFASCSDHPEWLIYTSGQTHKWMSSSLTDMIIETKEEDVKKVTKLKLNVTWEDDKRILSCRPAQDQDSGQIRNITLFVECECVLHVSINKHCNLLYTLTD